MGCVDFRDFAQESETSARLQGHLTPKKLEMSSKNRNKKEKKHSKIIAQQNLEALCSVPLFELGPTLICLKLIYGTRTP